MIFKKLNNNIIFQQRNIPKVCSPKQQKLRLRKVRRMRDVVRSLLRQTRQEIKKRGSIGGRQHDHSRRRRNGKQDGLGDCCGNCGELEDPLQNHGQPRHLRFCTSVCRGYVAQYRRESRLGAQEVPF